MPTKASSTLYGPLQIAEKAENVAYRLQLPAYVQVHHVFHVSCLKKFIGEVPTTPTVPAIQHGQITLVPKDILHSREHNSRSELLIHWDGYSPAEASWEDFNMMIQLYPSFAPKVVRVLKRGVMLRAAPLHMSLLLRKFIQRKKKIED